MNEKNNIVKKYGLERGITRKFLLEVGLMFDRELEIFLKRGHDKKKVEKNRGKV